MNFEKYGKTIMVILLSVMLVACTGCGAGSGTGTVENIDINDYIGEWHTDGFSIVTSEGGGIVADLEVSNKILSFNVYQISSDMGSDSSFECLSTIDYIVDNAVSIDFEDGNDSSGTANLQFEDNQIILDLHDVKDGDMATIEEGTFVLVPYDSSEEYSGNGPEDEEYYDDYEDEYYYPREDCEELVNVDSHYADNELLSKMRNYPRDYQDNSYSFINVKIEEKGNVNGSMMYITSSSETIVIVDCREDIYAPTISKGNRIDAYTVFSGIITDKDGRDYLAFNMFDVELK